MARYVDGPVTAATWILEEWSGNKPFTENVLAKNVNSNIDSIRTIFKKYVYLESWSSRLNLNNEMTIAQLRAELERTWTAAYRDAADM